MFIDDSTRKELACFLKNKTHVFATFNRWKAEMENEADVKIKCLRCDNDNEYNSKGSSNFV